MVAHLLRPLAFAKRSRATRANWPGSNEAQREATAGTKLAQAIDNKLLFVKDPERPTKSAGSPPAGRASCRAKWIEATGSLPRAPFLERSPVRRGAQCEVAGHATRIGRTAARFVGPIARLKRVPDNGADCVDPLGYGGGVVRR